MNPMGINTLACLVWQMFQLFNTRESRVCQLVTNAWMSVCAQIKKPDKPEVKATNLWLCVYDRKTITHVDLCERGVFVHRHCIVCNYLPDKRRIWPPSLLPSKGKIRKSLPPTCQRRLTAQPYFHHDPPAALQISISISCFLCGGNKVALDFWKHLQYIGGPVTLTCLWDQGKLSWRNLQILPSLDHISKEASSECVVKPLLPVEAEGGIAWSNQIPDEVKQSVIGLNPPDCQTETHLLKSRYRKIPYWSESITLKRSSLGVQPTHCHVKQIIWRDLSQKKKPKTPHTADTWIHPKCKWTLPQSPQQLQVWRVPGPSGHLVVLEAARSGGQTGWSGSLHKLKWRYD